MLEDKDVAGYLLERGLLEPEAVLDGDLRIHDVSSRNRNYRVVTRDGPCYLVKQARSSQDSATLAHEGAVYERLAGADGALHCFVPKYRGYDSGEGVLVLDLVEDAEDLRTFHVRTGAFSAGPAAALGAALGTLHRVTLVPDVAPAPVAAPWILSVDRPDVSVFRDVSAASLELIRIVQGTRGFAEVLGRLRGAWRPRALVHGDVKWDNCLVTAEEDVKLVDWEIAAAGDPCWDSGSALSHYLSFWLFSIPVTGSVPPARFPELAAYPLDAMKPALAASWWAYADALGLPQDSAKDHLIRTVEHAGARLLQTAFEAAQMMDHLTSALMLHLQLALNVMARPEDAARRLLGLVPSRRLAA